MKNERIDSVLKQFQISFEFIVLLYIALKKQSTNILNWLVLYWHTFLFMLIFSFIFCFCIRFTGLECNYHHIHLAWTRTGSLLIHRITFSAVFACAGCKQGWHGNGISDLMCHVWYLELHNMLSSLFFSTFVWLDELCLHWKVMLRNFIFFSQ